MNLSKLPQRSPIGHKGTFGTVAVFGGYKTDQSVMFGGTVLAATAALKAGAGKVTLVMPQNILPVAIEMLPQAVGESMSEQSHPKAQCFLVGPCLGREKTQRTLLQNLLSKNVPMVIDADALSIIAENPEGWPAKTDAILTPHIGEFERLTKTFGIDTNTSVQSRAAKLAQKLGVVFVVKNSTTTVCSGEQTWQLDKPNPALATAGSGDVLSGLIAGLVAQFYPKQLDLFECAQLGVALHSQAGELWSKLHGDQGLILAELIDLVPEAAARLR
ncbi:MAG TPA: NAD(P)H-hydrate dehydratase [Candidatus Saccharimonadales bacterium]|nr:NAD(P)H-hydrate dehydratase [Candidatus Saccharimonadales bacterium]